MILGQVEQVKYNPHKVNIKLGSEAGATGERFDTVSKEVGASVRLAEPRIGHTRAAARHAAGRCARRLGLKHPLRPHARLRRRCPCQSHHQHHCLQCFGINDRAHAAQNGVESSKDYRSYSTGPKVDPQQIGNDNPPSINGDRDFCQYIGRN